MYIYRQTASLYGIWIKNVLICAYIRILFTDVPSSKSSSAPVNVVYEECEMKNVVDMQHNPSYAVPSQVTGSERRGNENKMADKGGDIVTYEAAS